MIKSEEVKKEQERKPIDNEISFIFALDWIEYESDRLPDKRSSLMKGNDDPSLVKSNILTKKEDVLIIVLLKFLETRNYITSKGEKMMIGNFLKQA